MATQTPRSPFRVLNLKEESVLTSSRTATLKKQETEQKKIFHAKPSENIAVILGTQPADQAALKKGAGKDLAEAVENAHAQQAVHASQSGKGWKDVARELTIAGYSNIETIPVSPEKDPALASLTIFDASNSDKLKTTIRKLVQQVARRSHAIEQLLDHADAQVVQQVELRTNVAEISDKLSNALVKIAELEHAARVEKKLQTLSAENAAATISQLQAERDRATKDAKRAESEQALLQKEVKASRDAKQACERKQLILFEQLTGVATPRVHMKSDQRVLDVIAVCQSKIQSLKETVQNKEAEITVLKDAATAAADTAGNAQQPATTAAAALVANDGQQQQQQQQQQQTQVRKEGGSAAVVDKPLLLPGRRQLKAARIRAASAERATADLKDRNDALLLEMSARPSIQEWRQTRKRIAKLEAKLKRAATSASTEQDYAGGGSTATPPSSSFSASSSLSSSFPSSASASASGPSGKDHYHLHLYKIDALANDKCKDYLKQVCRHLRIASLSNLASKLGEAAAALAAAPVLQQTLLEATEQVMGELKTPGVEVSPSLLLSKIKGRSKLLQTQSDELQGLLKMRKAVWQVIEASYPVDEGNGILAGEHAELQVPPHIIEAHLRGLVKSYRILQARARTWAAAESALGLAGDAVDPGDGAQRIFVATLGYVQDLFQIDSLAGMIHGMNGVYSKLKEMHSVLQSIGSLADVEARSGSGASPSRILRAVQAKLEAAAAAAAIPTPVPAGVSVLGPPPGF